MIKKPNDNPTYHLAFLIIGGKNDCKKSSEENR